MNADTRIQEPALKTREEIIEEYLRMRERIDDAYDKHYVAGLDNGYKVKAEKKAHKWLREQLELNKII
jgi:hypothetical protein